MIVRPAEPVDLPMLTGIYNHYVETSHATFDLTPFTEAERAVWLARFDGARYQCWVAEEGGSVLGYASSSPVREKAAYATSVEVSVYAAAEATGRGIGRALYQRLLPALADEDLHRAYALIAQPNEPSMRLHTGFGFTEVSHLSEVGRKFDRYWDVKWLELQL